MAGYTAPAPRKKIALDNQKLVMRAACPSAKGKFSTLSWRLVNNNPRITVYTNDPADMTEKNQNGLISAELDAPTFFAFLQSIYQIIESDKPLRRKIENKNFIFPGGKRSEKPVLKSEIHMGKDEDGVIWISITSFDKERPKIKFEFGGGDFHNFFHTNGVPFTKGETSSLYARSMIKILENVMTHLMVTEYVEEVRKAPPGKDGNGNRNYSGGNNSNKSSSPEPDESGDDLPF